MEKSQASGKRLCRLCGRQKEEKNFTEFTLTVIGNRALRYTGCKSCGVVIHNASILIRETILKKGEEYDLALGEKNRITPSLVGN